MSIVRKLALVSILLLAVYSTFVFPANLQTQAQTEYIIEIRGYTWNQLAITVSILPQENQTWWKPVYLDAALQGISQWNDAIDEFAANNTDFSYLSQVHLVPIISYENVSGFDVYMGWIPECESEATIGQSRITAKSPCIATNGTVCFAAKAPSGHVMTETDMQNIIVHEIGHSLGLSHCNYTEDVMYPTVYYQDTVKPLSSLDIYAIAQIFDWIPNSTQPNSSITCPEESMLTMPLSISYIQYQIAKENLPPSFLENFREYIIELFTSPESLTTILVAVTLIVASALLFRRKKKSIS